MRYKYLKTMELDEETILEALSRLIGEPVLDIHKSYVSGGSEYKDKWTLTYISED